MFTFNYYLHTSGSYLSLKWMAHFIY